MFPFQQNEKSEFYDLEIISMYDFLVLSFITALGVIVLALRFTVNNLCGASNCLT